MSLNISYGNFVFKLDLIFNINTDLSAVYYSQTPIQTPFIWPGGVNMTQTTYRCRHSVLERTDKQGQPFLFEPSLRIGKGFIHSSLYFNSKNNYNNNDI